ncbi:dna2/nam7 helicase family member, putative [Plasmodium ovale]|uniref:Dna2/nam7 helicase family member, putative n=1 Tax=Plasmodium ovale TaxID=36330 RepID=A0A1C3KSB6_PLAOA|nr:dna2/nam7 helicase family member, putative [Plasmodium ovale]
MGVSGAHVLNRFERLIRLEHIYEVKEIELCYDNMSKEELIEKGILISDLTIKSVIKHNDNKNSYILKLVKKKKNIDTNDLSDDENLDNFNPNSFSKGCIVHFSKKRKKYTLHKEKKGNANCVINDTTNIYICTVHKIKKNQINIILRNINELCKEMNISDAFLLTDKCYFDVCLVNSEISSQRQLQAIKLMKDKLDTPSDIVKILFLGKSPSQSPFLRQVLHAFRMHDAVAKRERKKEKPEVEREQGGKSGQHEEGGKNGQLEEGGKNGQLEEGGENVPLEETLVENYFYKCDKTEWGNKNLNNSQKKAVYHCLYSNDIFCVHGPPGTGKTTVLCEIIYQLVKKKKKILVTGPSNVSVDNVISKCVDMNIKNIFRIGLKSKMKKELWNYSYEEKIKECDSYKLCEDINKDIEKLKYEIIKLKNKKKTEKIYLDKKNIINLKYEIKILNKFKKKKKNIFFNELMNKNNVVFSTCSSSANYELNNFVKHSKFLFDVVCIDECCQCTEPLCYIPISFSKKNVFLFGDHKQLSPLIKYNKNDNMLNITLFERLIKNYKNKVSFLLNIQYRMNDLILKWSNKIFYNNRLISHESCCSINVTDLIRSTTQGEDGTNRGKELVDRSKRGKCEKRAGKHNSRQRDGKNCRQSDGKNCRQSDGKNCRQRDGKNCRQSDGKNCRQRDRRKNDTEGEGAPTEEGTHCKDAIPSYSYCPITWVETDGFDEFLDDTKDEDMIHLEIRERDNETEVCKKSSKGVSGESGKREDALDEGDHVGEARSAKRRSATSLYSGSGSGSSSSSSSSSSGSSSGSRSGSRGGESAGESGDPKEVTDEELSKLVKINVEDILSLSNKSRSNSGEAYVIYKLVERMVKVDCIDVKNICIITPYSKQMNLLRNIFYYNMYDDKSYANEWKNIEISTVDSFQGREKEIVIFSLVCSNYFKNIGFLKDYRRLNVAITRAKRHVVIVGNSNTISNDKVLNQLYETVFNDGKVYLVNELIDVEDVVMHR